MIHSDVFLIVMQMLLTYTLKYLEERICVEQSDYDSGNDEDKGMKWLKLGVQD
jgi:hypothetical protein